jgi:putative oxidoreductase
MNVNLTHGEPSIRAREWGLAALRAGVGLVFLMHGWQKLFEMGIPGVAGFFGQLGIPAPMPAATLVSLLEFVGGAALLAGLFTRWVAIPLGIDALVATLLVHLPRGFFVAQGGYELVLLLLVGSVALALAGPGAFALDGLIARGRPSAAPVDRRREDVAA